MKLKKKHTHTNAVKLGISNTHKNNFDSKNKIKIKKLDMQTIAILRSS
jgi:hypothetical protein